MTLGIFLPTYKRSSKLQEVATNIERTTRSDFILYFGCEVNDTASVEAAKATGHKVVLNKYQPECGYSNTIQSIYEESKDQIFFHANDDFEFLDGWDVEPLNYLAEHPEVMVLGAHDGMPTPSYSTISFIRREYIEDFSGVVDMPNRVFYPYRHNYQDTEFTQTAQCRGVWDKIEKPCIKHHRIGGDETYSKNDATSSKDAETFKSREHLWQEIEKEKIVMPRKPMSDEEKQAARERMKAMWAAKKAKKETSLPKAEEKRPSIDETTPDAMLGRALEHVESAIDALIIAREENPDMIEAAQAVDALNEAKNRISQVQGLLRDKK